MSELGGRSGDSNGLSLMLGDSHTAANNFGLTGATFTGVPKSKFLFYVKFYRPDSAGADGVKAVGTAVKSVERPRVSFKTETLNQYNRKRVIQTSHEFESLQIKFHDTVDNSVQNLFTQYYQFYFGDSKLARAGSSVYDVVTPEADNLGKWGFHPNQAARDYGYFFSHISVYQIYQGMALKFDIINPKVRDFNPDDFDYNDSSTTAEIQMSLDYESIIYYESEKLSDELKVEMGLNRGQYWDVKDDGYTNAYYGVGNGDPAGSVGNAIGNVLGQNLASLITGQGTQSIGGIISSVAGQFDANRGLAQGVTGAKALKDLVSGNTSGAKQGVQGLLKGAIFGKPGKFF